MALKATIFKVDLSVADLDRNVYEDFSLTLAQHPSENDARMMVRLLAFMLFADERLEFGRGISSDDEPDLWLKDLTGAIDLWISVGQLDERMQVRGTDDLASLARSMNRMAAQLQQRAQLLQALVETPAKGAEVLVAAVAQREYGVLKACQ